MRLIPWHRIKVLATRPGLGAARGRGKSGPQVHERGLFPGQPRNKLQPRNIFRPVFCRAVPMFLGDPMFIYVEDSMEIIICDTIGALYHDHPENSGGAF